MLMLLNLSIRHFVIVEQLELEFQHGLNVFTGETGAGKSIILDALGLLLGARGEGSLVRAGEKRAELAARFRLPDHPECAAWLQEQALENDEGDILLRRVIESSGRSKSFINGQPVTLAQLKAMGDFLLEIHGQHAHQSLLKNEAQRKLLDAFAGGETLVAEVSQRWHAWQSAKKARLEAERCAQAYQSECEHLDWKIQDLQNLDVKAGEWETLGAQHSRLANAAELIETAEYARYALVDGEGSVLDLIAPIQNRLARLAQYDLKINETLAMLASAEAELREAAYALRDYASDVEEDHDVLLQMEKRIEKLHDAARKYRVLPEELPQLLAESEAARAQLDQMADPEIWIEKEKEAEIAYREHAEKLSLLRQRTAKKLGQKVSAEMQELAMTGARFAVELPPLASPGAFGLEQVDYLVSANAGMSLRPLAKVASGGELSRISLALQVVMSKVAPVETLIFDEVDVGIGGRVAEIVGRKLQQLSQNYQVLCITHLPQVAVFGGHHWLVQKRERAGVTESSIVALDQAARIEEIARMLGGERLTDTTRKHAQELLDLAAGAA